VSAISVKILPSSGLVDTETVVSGEVFILKTATPSSTAGNASVSATAVREQNVVALSNGKSDVQSIISIKFNPASTIDGQTSISAQTTQFMGSIVALAVGQSLVTGSVVVGKAVVNTVEINGEMTTYVSINGVLEGSIRLNGVISN
jgi:hypothetical protein